MAARLHDPAGADHRDPVDRYDPVVGTWRRGTPLPTPRHGIFGVEVADRVIVAGGGTRAGFSSSSVVEAYNPVRGVPAVQATTISSTTPTPEARLVSVRDDAAASATYSCALPTSSA